MNELLAVCRIPDGPWFRPVGLGSPFLPVLLALVFNSACQGDVQWESMHLEAPAYHDEVQLAYVVCNRGTQPIRMASVVGDCGCMNLTWPRESIEPGQRQRIDVTCDVSAARAGKTYHSMFVTWSDDSRQTLTFSVSRPGRGQFHPPRLIWDTERDRSAQETVFIADPDVIDVRCDAHVPGFDVKCQKEPNSNEWRIVATPAAQFGAGEYAIDVDVRRGSAERGVKHRLHLLRLISAQQRARADPLKSRRPVQPASDSVPPANAVVVRGSDQSTTMSRGIDTWIFTAMGLIAAGCTALMVACQIAQGPRMKQFSLICGIILLGIVLGIGGTTLWRQSNSPVPENIQEAVTDSSRPEKPKVPFASLEASETTWRFGEVETGTEIHHRFQLHNRGGQPLEIQRVRSSSAGLVARPHSTRILPGDTGILEVRMNLANMRGPMNDLVTIDSNDPENPSIQLHIVGDVYSRVQLSPEPLSLVATSRDEQLAGDVTIETTRGLNLNVLRTTTSASWVVAETASGATPANPLTIRVRATPPRNATRYDGWIHVHTDHDGQYRTLPIRVSIAGASRTALNVGAAPIPRGLVPGDEFHLVGRTLDEVPVDIKSFKGRTVIVVFWSSVHEESSSVLATIKAIHHENRSSGLAVVGVNLDRLRSQAVRFMEKHEMPWTTLCFPDAAGNPPDDPPLPLPERPESTYKLDPLPKVVVLDRDGRVAAVPQLSESLDSEIRSLLKPDR